MRNDRRTYARFDTDIDACAFFENLSDEIKCRVVNISEIGACVEIGVFPDYQEYIQKGSVMKLQFIDSFPFGSYLESDVINISCNIRYVEEQEGRLVIGCAVNSEDYKSYVRHRETARIFGKDQK